MTAINEYSPYFASLIQAGFVVYVKVADSGKIIGLATYKKDSGYHKIVVQP